MHGFFCGSGRAVISCPSVSTQTQKPAVLPIDVGFQLLKIDTSDDMKFFTRLNYSISMAEQGRGGARIYQQQHDSAYTYAHHQLYVYNLSHAVPSLSHACPIKKPHYSASFYTMGQMGQKIYIVCIFSLLCMC